jgi:methylated-DNA-[protein]-cysteine S-methyltransferase
MSDWKKCSTPLGEMFLASDGSALCGAWFLGQKYFPRLTGWREQENELFENAVWELQCYFKRQLRCFTVPLRPQGTPFQQKVWAGIAKIDYGCTATYGQLAKQLGSGPRAVGAATGHNPLSLFIPCHRVVGSEGFLTGYAGGLKRKKALLTLEGIEVKESEGRKNGEKLSRLAVSSYSK